MLRSPPPPLSVCFRSAVWCDIGVVPFEAEIIIEPQTTLQALIFFLNVFVTVWHGVQTDTTFDFLLLISVCNIVL
jgi:hypothetical protein